MGHLVGKDIYNKLGKKIDGLSVRAPYTKTLQAILKELYTPEEAELVVRMPYRLSPVDRIEKITKFDRSKLERMLPVLSSKGLLVDVNIRKKWYYMISPFVVGIFEFTMMRTGGNLNYKKWAELFCEYFEEGAFLGANFKDGMITTPLRTIPHEETIEETDHVEILDFEKASAIVDGAKYHAVGICSCRHEKLHEGSKKCDIPLENCLSFNNSADYMVRNGFAKKISKEEMQDILQQSKEQGLVMNAENSMKNVGFICNCCGCCCNLLLGINKHGYPNTLVTSNYIAKRDEELCADCEICIEVCPVDAIDNSDNGRAKIKEEMCIGCGVCALKCDTDSITLIPREQRVFYPKDTFERIIIQCLERGTLQNQLFDDPQNITQKFMRGIVGGFLKLSPVKRSLMSENLRSSFLANIRKRARK
ncbi:MAG: 4Fe-4S ferredoxin [bacterium]|nr:4Fe-4S ferredoxin [bacterium]